MRCALLTPLALLFALIAPTQADAQFGGDPRQPLNPTEMSVCDALRAQWSALHDGLRRQHDSCLSSTKGCRASNAEGASCSCSACESLHQERDRVYSEMNASVSHCRQQVRDYERQKREREEAERKRKEEAERRQREEEQRRQEAERKRKEDEDRRQREEEQRQRQEEMDRQNDQQDAEREQREAEADRRRRDAEREAQAEQQRRDDERRREEEAERDRVERERAREQLDRDLRSLASAADFARVQGDMLARQKATREARDQELSRQGAALSQQAGARQDKASSGLSEAFDQLKGAVSGLTESDSPASGTNSGSAGGLLSGFDMDAADAGSMATIDRLLDQGKSSAPFASIPFELIRNSVHETVGGMDRVFAAIADVENADPRALDDFVNGYGQRVMGPRKFAEALGQHWGDGVRSMLKSRASQQVARPLTRETERRAAEAFRQRDTRALFRPAPTRTPAVQVRQWWTSQATGRSRVVTDERGTPILLDAEGKLYRFDNGSRTVSYTPEQVQELVARHGLRVARVDETEFVANAAYVSLMPREDELLTSLGERFSDWMAGQIAGIPFALTEDRK